MPTAASRSRRRTPPARSLSQPKATRAMAPAACMAVKAKPARAKPRPPALTSQATDTAKTEDWTAANENAATASGRSRARRRRCGAACVPATGSPARGRRQDAPAAAPCTPPPPAARRRRRPARRASRTPPRSTSATARSRGSGRDGAGEDADRRRNGETVAHVGRRRGVWRRRCPARPLRTGRSRGAPAARAAAAQEAASASAQESGIRRHAISNAAELASALNAVACARTPSASAADGSMALIIAGARRGVDRAVRPSVRRGRNCM